MFVIQFDPITTNLVVGKKKKQPASAKSSATLSALVVSNDLSLLIDNLTILDQIEVTENGAFIVNEDSMVEVT